MSAPVTVDGRLEVCLGSGRGGLESYCEGRRLSVNNEVGSNGVAGPGKKADKDTRML